MFEYFGWQAENNIHWASGVASFFKSIYRELKLRIEILKVIEDNLLFLGGSSK